MFEDLKLEALRRRAHPADLPPAAAVKTVLHAIAERSQAVAAELPTQRAPTATTCTQISQTFWL